MQEPMHMPILRRAGTVLLVVGLADIAVMILCISMRVSYSSSVNVFAVAAGVFLRRGSLRAALIVRWFSAFLLSGIAAMVVGLPFILPLDLILTLIRLHPVFATVSVMYVVLVDLLLLWVYRELGRQPVMQASTAAGLRIRSMRVPMIIGIGMVTVTMVAIIVALRGESAAKAKDLAEQQLGAGYHYHVSSLRTTRSSHGASFRADVRAWNQNESRTVSVDWTEP